MSNDREAGARPTPEYARELMAGLADAHAQGRAAILGHVTVDTSHGTRRLTGVARELDVDQATRDALDALAMADHHSDPFHRYVARYAAERRLTAAAMDMTITHGPMSEARAELVHARAALTLAGQHAAADALGRELVGVR